jgi:DNA replicative helicase MCM subunit Mcm2 (Cdc46/Mcm family)
MAEVIQQAVELGIDDDKAEEMIKRLKKDGAIFEPKNGLLKIT